MELEKYTLLRLEQICDRINLDKNIKTKILKMNQKIIENDDIDCAEQTLENSEDDADINYDQICLDKREGKYKRKDTFVKMANKHYNKKCLCKKNDKICHCCGIIDLSKFGDIKYLEELYEKGVFDTMYNICQSTTQSLKAKAGLDLEDCIIEILEEIGLEKGIGYETQVFITNNGIISKKKSKEKNSGHTVDIMIPAPHKYPLKYSDYKGEMVSCKTSLRERFHQDRFLGNFTLISLEKKNDIKEINSVQICPKKKELTQWLNKIKVL